MTKRASSSADLPPCVTYLASNYTMMIAQRRLPVIHGIILALVCLFVFWKPAARSVQAWDEARNGVNAYEMYHNHDFVNLYYAGAPDTWNAKPPLLIWLIAGSYRLAGFNGFALRLPAALSVIAFFIYALKFARRVPDKRGVLLACAILLGCKAVLGIHTGLTGDFDAPLLFFLLASAYYFFCYIELGRLKAIYAVAIFSGLAFYTKGMAAFVYLPGYLLYGSIRKGGFRWLRDYRILWAALIMLLFIGSWVALTCCYGRYPGDTHYGSHNAIETMVVHDTWQRLTSAKFDGGQPADYAFCLTVLDTQLNLWNYVLYIGLAAGLYKWLSARKAMIVALSSPHNALLLYSICIAAPQLIFLTLACSKHHWYLAPAYFFIAYIMATGLIVITKMWRGTRVLYGLLLAFTIAREGYYINSLSGDTGRRMSGSAGFFKNDRDIITAGPVPQDMYLYLEWTGKKITPADVGSLGRYARTIVVGDSALLAPVAGGLRGFRNAGGYGFGYED